MTTDDHERRDRGRRKGPWIAALVVLLALVVAGAVIAAVVSDDGDGDVAGQVRSTADDGVDAVTSAGDDALDTVTSEGDDAIDEVTGDDAGDTTTAPQAVKDDPVVQRLAKGRDLPFTAGPWAREQYRDRVFDRLSEATRQRAEKVALGQGSGIRIR